MQLDTSDTGAVPRFISMQDLMQDTSDTGAESRFVSVALDEISMSICEKRSIWSQLEPESYSTFMFSEPLEAEDSEPQEGHNFGGGDISDCSEEIPPPTQAQQSALQIFTNAPLQIPPPQEKISWWMPQVFQFSPSDIRHEMRQYRQYR